MATPLKLKIKPLDPLISRDSRPFGQGQGTRIRSLDWLYPSVVCGALRSSVGKTHGSFDVSDLSSIKIRGPFLECGGRLFFPRPLDFVTDENLKKSGAVRGYRIRPVELKPGEGGTEMPLGLLPTFLKLNNTGGLSDHDFKPEHVPAFWSVKAMRQWLAEEENFSLSSDECLDGPAKDERVHVGIDPATGASSDSLLFSTTGLDFRAKTTAGEILQITAAIEATPPDSLYEQHINDMSRLHTIGGERRLAEWSVEKTDTAGWSPPPAPGGLCLRMILATPAIFEHGWVPGWIDKKNLEGKIPDTSVEVRLVSAIAQRWLPISGWSYARPYGPKPLRRMVPTGSVYFFEAKRELDSQDWNNMWLSSVCDNPQDKNDGFGAALWGTW